MKGQGRVDSCIRRWPTPRARDWVGRFLDRVRGDGNVVAVVAIGSAVRFGVDSEDLDIVVVCRRSRALGERPPLEVDLRAFDLSEVDERIAAGHDLLGWAVVFGRVLFDRRGAWRRVVERWEQHVPLPNPETVRERAAGALKRMNEMREMGDVDAAVELEVAYLSHRARGVLAEAGVYPASRPELPGQLRNVGARRLAEEVAEALAARARLRKELVG